MDAGREMDALIAEKVMGMGIQWTVQQHPDGTFTPTGEVWYDCPEFSTDLAAAWEAVDYFCALYGCAVKVERVQPVWERHGMRYAATVTGGSIGYERFDCTMSAGSNDRPAHALCLVLIEAAKHVVTKDDLAEQSARDAAQNASEGTITP